MSSKATPDKIARYGHVAAIIREYMRVHDLRQVEFAEKIHVHQSVVANWLRCVNGPGVKARRELAKLMDLKQFDFARKPLVEAKTVSDTRATALTTFIGAKPAINKPVLTYSVTSDGIARIQVDVSLPVATATPLLRMLLDAGMVFTPDTEA